MNYKQQKEACLKTGHVRTDNHRYSGFNPNLCGIITHRDCLPHRIIEQSTDFGYLNSKDISFKILEEIGMNSARDINYEFAHLNVTKDQIEEEHPDLWFRVLLTCKHIVVAVKKEDKDNFTGHDMCFDQTIREFVDWTYLNDNPEAEKFLLVDMKRHKRILGCGEKPVTECCAIRHGASVDKHALRTKKIVKNMDYIKKEKIPKSEQEPLHVLSCAVKTEKGMEDVKFKDFLTYRIDEKYKEEWEEYFGEFESESMQRYLEWLYKSNDDYDFLSVIFKK